MSFVPERLRLLLRPYIGRFKQHPPIGWVRMGSLRRLQPISTQWGEDRGGAVDRYYIEEFLDRNASDIRGHVLEVGDDIYAKRFGGNRVTHLDVLNVTPGNAKATIIADLSGADVIPANQFDCIVLTQTLQMIYDLHAALGHIHRILRPGGVALVTTHGISKLDLKWNDQWHLTSHSAHRLFGEFFPPESLLVQAYGNVLSAVAYLHGVSHCELHKRELDFCDPAYEVLITVRAVKSRQ
jgi:SAM-dependent methyltransferase